ncbi:hypothetical protein B0H17DRAFT_942590 [Mycena rosella]|uniref:FAD-binding domain-containing protein n=1 Tax=Mycena rosella TaxID=1033263 RepID=A0AAD7D6T7_MYCRO|nr:hypothetical protein B0H17DRAFT_942590 [Mycena rosella]
MPRSGCGIGGLTLAACISKFSEGRVAVDIYEAEPEVPTFGAVGGISSGVAIWKHSWQVLQDLGLEEEIVRQGFDVPTDGASRGPIFRKSDQSTEGYDFHTHILPYRPLGLHRLTLLEILRSKLSPDCKVHPSKRLERYEVSSEGFINLVFSDFEITTADILVGADGVHSATRQSMFRYMGDGYEQYILPVFNGTIAYRGMLPKTKLVETYPDHRALDGPKLVRIFPELTIYCLKCTHVVSHPVGPSIGIGCFRYNPDTEGQAHTGPSVADVPTQEATSHFETWEPDIRSLIQHVESYSAWAIHVVKPLPCYAQGSVVLIGDAAHAMTPHQGVGAAQAIEDAHVLGRLLAHPSAVKEKIQLILKLYEELRLPPTQEAAEKSHITGMMYEFNHPSFLFNDPSHPDGPSREELKALGNTVGISFVWLADSQLEEEWAEAEARLKEICEKPE